MQFFLYNVVFFAKKEIIFGCCAVERKTEKERQKSKRKNQRKGKDREKENMLVIYLILSYQSIYILRYRYTTKGQYGTINTI